MKNDLKKSDLKTGMHVILRNNDKCVVLNEYKIYVDIEDGTFLKSDYIGNDLIHNSSKNFDIIKVYDWKHRLVWERKEKSQLSEDEKVILRNIPEKWKWIARDKDGWLCIYNEKPKKVYDTWCGSDYLFIEVFEHLFQFIKWEDEEPYLISDLLGGKNNEN